MQEAELPEKTLIGLFSDIHFGVGRDSDEQLETTLNCVKWITEEFKARKVDAIFFLGDWFHTRFSLNTRTLNAGLEALDDLGSTAPVYLILGNHDNYFQESTDVNSIKVLEKASSGRAKAVTLEPLRIRCGGKSLLLCPWGSERLLDGETEKADYVFGHFEINGVVQPGGLSSGCRFSVKDLFRLSGEIFSGHYHLQRDYFSENGKSVLHMIGCPYQQNWSDSGSEKFIWTLRPVDGVVEKIKNRVSPEFSKIYMSRLETGGYLEEELKALCRGNYVKLVADAGQTFNSLVKANSRLKELGPRSCETEYLVAGSDGKTAIADGFGNIQAKSYKEYVVDYLKKIFPDLRKADQDLSLDRLISMAGSYAADQG